MARDGKLPVVDAVKSAYGFVPIALPRALPAYALYALVAGFLQQASYQAAIGGQSAAYFLGGFIAIFLGIACSAMVYRIGLRNEYSGIFGLKFSNEEWSLLGASALLWLLIVITYFIAFLFLGLMFGIFFASSGVDTTALENDPTLMADAMIAFLGTSGGFIFIGLAGLVILGLLWIYARLILYGVASVDQKTVAVFSTYEWTRGNGWRIILSILGLLPLYLGGLLVYGVTMNALGIPLTATIAPDVTAPVSSTSFLILGFVTTLAYIPVIIAAHGLSIFLYQGFKPSGPSISEAFD